MIAGIVVGAYLIIAILTAKYTFGIQRRKQIEHTAASYRYVDPIKEFEDDQIFYVVGALALGLIWPVMLPFEVLTYWFIRTAPESEVERKLREKAQEKRIAELERELHIGR